MRSILFSVLIVAVLILPACGGNKEATNKDNESNTTKEAADSVKLDGTTKEAPPTEKPGFSEFKDEVEYTLQADTLASYNDNGGIMRIQI